jgi:hypothetical protein
LFSYTNLSRMHIQTLHRPADCFFEVQGGLSGKASSEINSTEASDVNRVPSTARGLKMFDNKSSQHWVYNKANHNKHYHYSKLQMFN